MGSNAYRYNNGCTDGIWYNIWLNGAFGRWNSHVFAICLSWLAYVLVRKLSNNKKFTGDTGKKLSLSGYTSGLLLIVFALFIIIEAVERLYNPVDIMRSYVGGSCRISRKYCKCVFASS